MNTSTPIAKTVKNSLELTQQQVSAKIFLIRNHHVLLDNHLAAMYGVETKALNKAVSRNLDRFPDHFRFQLNQEEWIDLRFQLGTSSDSHGGRRFAPYVFTEQGVAMLSAVLNSQRAVQVSIRIMDTFVEMRRFFLQNANLFQKVERIEVRQLAHIAESDEKFNTLFNALDSHRVSDPPRQGVFFNGQIFDAYALASKIIRGAKKSIDLIDNYIDESVLTMLSKRNQGVSASIHMAKPSKQIQLDLEKYNAQYPPIQLQIAVGWHDRFLIVDRQDVYHIGASLKDLGKKCFAFSRLDSLSPDILQKFPQGQPTDL
jgi:phage regulator Rha-like protein